MSEACLFKIIWACIDQNNLNILYDSAVPSELKNSSFEKLIKDVYQFFMYVLIVSDMIKNQAHICLKSEIDKAFLELCKDFMTTWDSRDYTSVNVKDSFSVPVDNCFKKQVSQAALAILKTVYENGAVSLNPNAINSAGNTALLELAKHTKNDKNLWRLLKFSKYGFGY